MAPRLAPPPREWLSRMASSGLRITRPRKAVMGLLAATDRPLTPLQVYDALRRASPRTGVASVYRTLQAMEELGLAERVHQLQGCQAYLPVRPGHRHLILCRSCGRSRDFGGDRLEGLIARVGRELGYRIENHFLQLAGVCPECQQRASA